MNIKEIFLHVRYQKGWSNWELAKQLGVNRETVYFWQRENKIHIKHWKKIFQVTGIDMREHHPQSLKDQEK